MNFRFGVNCTRAATMVWIGAVVQSGVTREHPNPGYVGGTLLVFVLAVLVVNPETVDSVIRPALNLQRATLDDDVVAGGLWWPARKREGGEGQHATSRNWN